MAEMPEKPQLSPTALPLETAAKVLSGTGGKPVTVEMLQADIDAGAPLNADGTLNLVHYAAWLVRQSRVELNTAGRGHQRSATAPASHAGRIPHWRGTPCRPVPLCRLARRRSPFPESQLRQRAKQQRLMQELGLKEAEDRRLKAEAEDNELDGDTREEATAAQAAA